MADEKKVEDYLTLQVERRGGLCVKFVPQYFAGFPDRLVLTGNGATIYVELKAPHIGKPEPLQKLVAGKLRRRGHRVELLNTREKIDAFIESVVW